MAFKKIKPEDSAFPTTAPFHPGVDIQTYIATEIAVGLLIRGNNQPNKDIAKEAVKLADDIIDQLNKDR